MALDNTQQTTDSIRLRSYQSEMLEESIRRNIIVAMDTGSGKTHIAIARAGAALETCPSEKRVWFLAPTIALCEQQFAAFQKHLPAYQSVILTGNDNVEKWNVRHWEAALKNQRIVLSTYMVLLQSLEHAFVRISDLALIIFDEVHHAKDKHPAGQIMTQHYHPLLASGMGDLPAVLGLTASPVINAKANALEKIETNLDSQVVVPQKCRSELLQHVHPPVLLKEVYNSQISSTEPLSLQRLREANQSYDIENDPYVIELAMSLDPEAASKLTKVIISGDTYCRQELKQICSTASKIFLELGSSPLELYLNEIMSELKKSLQNKVGGFGFGTTQSEQQHLLSILNDAFRDVLPIDATFESDRLSYKLNVLVDILVREASPTFMGIIFVQERATVGLLGRLLSLHPKIRNVYRIGTFVGSSTNRKRKRGVAESIVPKNGPQTLAEFRSGEKNLMIATDVLEEGIDVPILNTVICFEPPKNLKSFIQRRGRARHHESKYIIMLPELEPLKSSDPEIWRELEQVMRQAYEDEEREAEIARRLEEVDEQGERTYRVPSTGALLTLDNAMGHLQHFCDKLQLGAYVNPRPQFSFAENPMKGVTAEVTLPIAVDAAVRKAKSLLGWKTEKKASKDAAFQAYVALHKAGLVNDNLLPVVRDTDQGPDEYVNRQAAFTSVNSCYDPWVELSHLMGHDDNALFEHRVTLRLRDTSVIQMTMLLPTLLPQAFDFPLYWNNKTVYNMRLEPLAAGKVHHSDDRIDTIRLVTSLLLSSIYGPRMPMGRMDFCALFVPYLTTFTIPASLDQWLASMKGVMSANEAWQQFQTGNFETSDFGLMRRDGNPNSRPFIFKDFDKTYGAETPAIAARQFPKRRDFHHKIPIEYDQNRSHASHELLDANNYYFDKLSYPYSLFAAFVPALLHQVEIRLRSQKLQYQLSGVGISNTELVLEAITHSSAGEAFDYQRLEFIGDCFLKYLTSLNLMAQHLNWPEGFLTSLKGRIVSNGSLKNASLAVGLDRFLMTTSFTGAKWRPHYLGDFEQSSIRQTAEKRTFSSKAVADVVESLIGACLMDGGVDRAHRCVEHLLNDRKWLSPSSTISMLFSDAPAQGFFSSPPLYLQLESVLGYSFNKKSLALQAITHGSYQLANGASYERLEFLGDAVLDFITVQIMSAHSKRLSHIVMHTLRTAVVNADLLAFLCMHFSVIEQRTKVTPAAIGDEFIFHEEPEERKIWQFLHHVPGGMDRTKQATNDRYMGTRDKITQALDQDTRYPWALLAHLNAPKFFSDMIESILGAIFIDSQGSLPVCEAFLERIGLLPILRRFLRDEVDCLHPKDRIGQMADQEKVKYVRSFEDGMYRVSVRIGEREIGSTVEGLSQVAADTEAATRAIEIMERGEDAAMDEDGGVAL